MIYQFIPVAPVRVMERLIRSMRPGTMAVLDLEDGYFDVQDPGKTGERRASTYQSCGGLSKRRNEAHGQLAHRMKVVKRTKG